MKKLLVTGSGGFIFSNFIRHIRNNPNYKISSIDKISQSQALHTVYSNKNHTFYIGDITDSHLLDIIFQVERPDIVIHGAASSFVDASIKSAPQFVNDNVLGTQTLIDAALKYGVERFVYISSDEVYGQLTNESEDSWTEDSMTNPRNPYAATKLAGELLVRAAHTTHGLQYNITRCCNNYGPKQPNRNLIPKIVANIIDKKPVPIYGQGMQMRDWLFVQDNCDAIMTIIEKAPLNEIYNISANQEYTNIEIFQEICNIMGSGHDLLTFVPDRPGHDFRYSVNSTKLSNLGWSPKVKLKKGGLEHTINWYKANAWFLKQSY